MAGKSGGNRRGGLALRIVAVLAALLLIAIVAGYWYERPMLLTGTGYAAHNACAVRHVAGRSDPRTDLPHNPLVPVLRDNPDPAQQSVRASVLGALAPQQAWYTPGYGCTVAESRPTFAPATPIPATAHPLLARTSGPPGPGATPAVHQAVDRAFGDDLDDAARAALGTRAVVVVHRGTIVGERYAAGFTEDTPQLGWSMAKSVTNLLTGRLVMSGRIGVGQDRLRPEWTDEKARITVDDLMRMTSGLSWDETYDLGTPITQMLYREPDMAAYVAARPLAHPPGSYQQYSSGSTNVLCSVLRSRTSSGPDLPRTELLAPLGLSSAVWEPDAAGTPVCGSYLWATPRDWAVLGQFALQDGVWQGRRLLPEGWMTASTTVKPVARTEEGGNYAAGWRTNRKADGGLQEPRLPADTYWASGHDGQRLYVVPSAQLVVVRMGFSPDGEAPDLRTDALVAELVAGLTGTG